ncbi:hypothetical protein QZH41_017822, partial [Actinostola sp. cb2023]
NGYENSNYKGKWYKYNDTFVEEFDMNDENLEAECFGGTYKATVYDTVNSYPETRHRYWNGYMLFYEAVDNNKIQNNLLHPTRGPLIRQEAIIEGRLEELVLNIFHKCPWRVPKEGAQGGCPRRVPKEGAQGGCPRRVPKEGTQGGCPRRVPKEGTQGGCPRRVPKEGTQGGYPRRQFKICKIYDGNGNRKCK